MAAQDTPRLLVLLRDCLEVSAVAEAKNGGVPEGNFFAVDLDRIVDSPLCRLPQPIKDASKLLGAEAQSAAAPHKRVRHGQYSRVDGLRSSFPEFCHVFQPEGFEGDDTWLRVALVETAIRKALPRDQREGLRTEILDEDDRNVLGLIAYQPPLEWGEIFHKLVVMLGQALISQAGGLKRLPQIPDAALGGVSIPNLEAAKAHRRVSRALVNGFAYIAGLQAAEHRPRTKPGPRPSTMPAAGPSGTGASQSLHIDPVGRFPIPDSLRRMLDQDEEAPPVDDFVDLPLFARAPSPRTVLEEEGEDVDGAADEATQTTETAKACQEEAEAAHMLFLSGSLQPEVARVLSPPIFAAVMEHAESRAFAQPDDDVRAQLAWVVLMMSGLTSRHPQIIVDALRRLADPALSARTDEFVIDRAGFWSRLRLREEHDRKTPPSRLPPLHFGWPTTFAQRFGDLWASRSDWTSVLSTDPLPLVHAASQTLRDKLFSQFSLLRLRNTLASAVFTGGGDDCLAQLAAGDTLRHSDGALHYYSNVQGRMRRQFAWAMCGWLPPHWVWNVRTLPGDDTIFGLPRSRLPDTKVASAIGHLAARADELPPPRADSPALCAHHDRFTAYVVALFAACTAHRLTEHLGDVTRRHLVLRWASQHYGVATFLDKLTVCALSSRATALTSLVVAQIEIYLAHLARMVDRLERQGRRHRYAIQALQAAIRGDGPLFVHLGHDEQVRGATRARAFTTSDLSALWPEWHYPGYVLRHRFASFAWRFGLSRDDIARQMGHAIDGVAFDEADPDSVIRFVERLARPSPGQQEALLDRALRAEGWRVVRSWIPERIEVPDAEADSAQAIAAEQRDVIRTHEKLQAGVTRNAMGKTVVIDETARKSAPDQQRSLFEAARELARSRFDEWLAMPEQESVRETKTLLRDDVDRLMAFATAAMPDRRYLIPVTNVLRNRLQRLRTEKPDGWKVELPAPVSVLRVAPPSITPACARAYNYCVSVLEVCDRWILDHASPAKAISDAWLGAVVLQLVLRNGITRRDILVEVLANASLWKRHPLLADTVLVPVGLGQADIAQPARSALAPEDIAKERGESAEGGDEDEEERHGQYVMVQGIAALAFVRWARTGGFSVDEQSVGRVAGAVARTLAGSVSESALAAIGDRTDTVMSPSGNQWLDAFLTCAQLARRLTMPGIRSAWEDGRLSARTIDLDRQMDAWHGNIQRMLETVTGGSPRARATAGHGTPTTTAEILTRLREVLTLRESERGRPRSGQALIAEVEELERQFPEILPTARWAIRYLKSRLKRVAKREHRASLYEDYVVWRKPFLVALGESDLSELGPDALTAFFVKAMTQGCSDPARALRVTRGIIKELVIDGLEPPDMAELFQAGRVARPIAAAYLVSPIESEWVGGQLREWIRWARTSGTTVGMEAFEIEAASELWDLQYWTGMRTAEGVHLRHAEVILVYGEWFIVIRRLQRRGVKTDASVRVIRLRQFLPPETLERFVAFLAHQQRAHRRRNDPSVGIFARPEGPSRVAGQGRITQHLNSALRLILPARSGRPYAGRHAQASYAVQAVLPTEHRSPGWHRQAAPQIPAYLQHLPLRFQLRFISRALGHAYATSTLTFYTHSLADMRALDRGWTRPSRALIAAAGGENASSVGVWLARAGVSARETSAVVAVVMDILCGEARACSIEPTLPFEAVPPASRIQYGTLSQMTHWVRDWLTGEKLSVLEYRYGISAELLGQSVREIERLDHLYNADLLDRSVCLDGIDAALLTDVAPRNRRRPRLPQAEAVAKTLDEIEQKTPALWSSWIEYAKRSRRGFAQTRSAGDPEVAAVLHRLTSGIESGKSGASSTQGAHPRLPRDLVFVTLLALAREQVRLANAVRHLSV